METSAYRKLAERSSMCSQLVPRNRQAQGHRGNQAGCPRALCAPGSFCCPLVTLYHPGWLMLHCEKARKSSSPLLIFSNYPQTALRGVGVCHFVWVFASKDHAVAVPNAALWWLPFWGSQNSALRVCLWSLTFNRRRMVHRQGLNNTCVCK